MWKYHGIEMTDNSQFPVGTLGFVYLITRISDGKAYFGKKLAYFKKTSVKTITMKNGKKKKKKTTILIPSDWKTYWSSSKELIDDVAKLGEEAFTREILCFCSNKGTLSYVELRYQMDHRVLENRTMWYNGIINARVNWNHIRPLLETLPTSANNCTD